MLKTNPLTYKIKDLNGEKITGSFYENDLLLNKLLMSFYPESDCRFKDKVKALLNLSNYATKK